MSHSFNVNEYWLKRGKTYAGEERLTQAYHRLQEQFLVQSLREGGLPMRRIVELGCGFGRITRLLAHSFPEAEIVALDLSPEQLANARDYCSGLEHVRFEPFDFYSGAPLPGGEYDVAIAVEVFLHHPPELIRGLLQRVIPVSTFIVNLDWSEPWPWKTPPHVWVHDYPAIYRQAGRECAVLPLPQKVDGMQQKLFIATAQLPARLSSLEQRMAAGGTAPPCPADQPVVSPSARWYQDLAIAVEEIRRVMPPASRFILVDEDQWGKPEGLNGFTVLPFLERGGQYWGPPADDASAIRELEWMRQRGASHLVFAWSSFWWLDYYAELKRHLQAACPCLLANERLIVFRLEP